MPELCSLFSPYDHALSSRIEIVCADPLGIDNKAVYGYRLLSPDEAVSHPGIHGFIVKICRAELSIIGYLNQDGTLSPVDSQPTARLMPVDDNIQINICDLDPQHSFVTSSSYLEYVVGLAHMSATEPACYVIENSLYQINLEKDRSEDQGSAAHDKDEAHNKHSQLHRDTLRETLPSFVQEGSFTYEVYDAHPDFDLHDARRIATPEALGVLTYLLWGNPKLSLAPLERSIVTGMSTELIGKTLLTLENLSESEYPMSTGFQEVISEILTIQKASLGVAQSVETPYERPVQNDETPHETVWNDRAPYVETLQDDEVSYGEANTAEHCTEGLIPFDLIFNGDSQFFSIVPRERERGLTSFLVGLETKLMCASIANELLIACKNPQALTSELLFTVAENAAVRRIARRSPWPFLPQELQACAIDLQAEPRKIRSRAYPREFDARMMIGTLFRKTNFTVPLYRTFFTIDLLDTTEKRGVCDFEFPASSYLPKHGNNPYVLGACSLLTNRQKVEQFKDYISGLALAQGMLLFNAAPTLDTVVVNAYAPDPFIHIPEARVERNTSPYPAHCILSVKVDHTLLDKDALYLIGDTAEVLEMDTGGFTSRASGFDPKHYLQEDLFSDPPAYAPVKPYLTCFELNGHNLSQNSSLINDLLSKISIYEPTTDERASLSTLRSLLEELDILASNNQHGRYDQRICESLQAHEPIVQKILRELAGKTLYAFDSIASQIIYNEHFGFAESSVQVDPLLAEFYLALGTSYANLEQYPQAIHAYRSGLAISPGEAVFYTELAWISYCLRDFTTMRRYLDEAAKLAYHEEDIARYYCCEAAYAYEYEEYQKAGVYTLLCMKWNSQLFAEFLSQLIADITRATGRPQAGVTPLNLEILMNHYNISYLPHEQSFIALEKFAREFVNTRNFPEGVEILEALYPFVQQEGVADVLFTIPEQPFQTSGEDEAFSD